jgi:hypothetical protein
MVTKNNIAKWFSDFASNHTQLKDYGYGDFSDISMERATTYPLMWVSPQPCSIEGNQISYSYTIAIADRCDKERNNAIEVESDTFQICLDILAGANDQATITGWELSETSTLTPFFETWKDEVEGHMVTITLIVDFDYDKCSIPTISPITPPSGGLCADGRVTVNATFYNDVASGGALNVVVKNVAGSLVGSLIGGEWIVPNAITCVDVDVELNGTFIESVASGGTSNTLVKNTLGAQVGSLIGGEWIVPSLVQSTQIKGYWGATVTDLIQLTIDADNAGTYTSISDDGSSGTITLSKNGGAFGAFSSPLVLVATDTLDVKRTTSTGVGFFKIVGTY